MSTKRAESRTRYFIRKISEKKGWNVAHVNKNGDFLEEQEISDTFKDIGLGLDKPDFLVCLKSEPIMIIEAKNSVSKIENAISEAIEYAEVINKTKKYNIKLAVGVAGEDDNGYQVVVKYNINGIWQELKSCGYALTTIPSKREVELSIIANDATTKVSIPSASDFIDSAIELSSLLRSAKIEAPLRPKVLGAVITALYQGDIDTTTGKELSSINKLVATAINESIDLDKDKKKKLISSLYLTSADFDRLAPKIQRIIAILKKLNIRSVLQTDTDFLGLLYEAFLRYGYDNNALGIVFTPRHITNFCVELIEARLSDRVIDIASGTGGFLVAAFDKMMSSAKGPKAIEKIKNSLYGFDTNPTVWALATLNMFFRGDGKSHIENGNCFDKENEKLIAGKFTRAFLNPPFSQEDEPERDFINAAMNALEPGGLIACVVKAGIFADDDNAKWRNEFLKKHTLLGMISLPDDLFYPTAAPTSIIIAQAHIPMEGEKNVFMARISNDGYTKLKGKRVQCEGSQLPLIKKEFENFKNNITTKNELVTVVKASNLMKEGAEFSPQQWLPQPKLKENDITVAEKNIKFSIFQTVTAIPDIADEVIEDFGFVTDLPNLEYGKQETINYFFEVNNGKSAGEKNYTVGTCPYISSGDLNNSIIRLVSDEENELFLNGGITVTAFGQAYVQPWRFIARGNGGSSVRVLIPKFKMTFEDLVWFAAQINLQRWRFFYGRMAIKSRLEKLKIISPPHKINTDSNSIACKIAILKKQLDELIY
ncbi:N-6 DNA methylase [bacterium]|nr:N-6 DNA methylase [bacterium]